MTSPHLHEFRDQKTLCHQLAQRITTDLQGALDARGRASVVVSGGRTPVPLFTALARIPIKWDRVFITLADERWVEIHDPDSNETLVREHLLHGHGEKARFRGLRNDRSPREDDPHPSRASPLPPDLSPHIRQGEAEGV